MTRQADAAAVRILIEGRVQGVGYRYWVRERAGRKGLDGWVRNLADGRVEALFAGQRDQVSEMISACWHGPRFARVTAVVESDCKPPPAPGFDIKR